MCFKAWYSTWDFMHVGGKGRDWIVSNHGLEDKPFSMRLFCVL